MNKAELAKSLSQADTISLWDSESGITDYFKVTGFDKIAGELHFREVHDGDVEHYTNTLDELLAYGTALTVF